MTSFVVSGFGLPEGPVVLGARTDGTAIVPSPNPLTRLHFFDGRLLKGTDLTLEQNAERTLAMLLAQSSGSGVAWGFDVGRQGETLTVSAGFAFDLVGHPLLLPSDISLSIADLLGAHSASTDETAVGSSSFERCALGQPVEATVDPIASATSYLLTVGWIEGFCGTMDIYGAACEQACVSGTDRPYRVDGVVFRLRPLQLRSPLPTSRSVLLTSTHLRSRIAAAYFADERVDAGVVISAASLASGAWCRGGGAPNGSEIPLAIVVRFGNATGFHDEWAARRERLETPARVGFDGRLAMRPRAVWDAQVAQFQCQLADRLGAGGLPSGPRRLIDGGIVELPPSGFLPVDQGADVVAQVTAMMGSGVDLRFVPVPIDVIPHEIEAVQHRDRIGLLLGLDDPNAKPPVDILVPDGASAAGTATGQLFRLELSIDPDPRRGGEPVVFTGTARLSPRGTGFTLSGAGLSGVTTLEAARRFVSGVGAAAPADPPTAPGRTVGSSAAPDPDTLRTVAAATTAFVGRVRGGERAVQPSMPFKRDDPKPIAGRAVLVVDGDPWSLGRSDSAFVHLAIDVLTPVNNGTAVSLDVIGQLSLDEGSGTGSDATRAMRFTGQMSVTERTDPPRLSPVELAATVQRSASPDGGNQQYLVRGVEDLLQLLQFGGTPFTVLAATGRQRDVLRLVEDPTVADANSPLRQNADVALQLLRAARPFDSQFYERAQLATFGTIGTDAPAMVSGRDWVAFRRRPPVAPAAAAPPRTVQIWVHAAANHDEAASAGKLLLSGDGDQLQWRRVGAAGFDATSGALVTEPDVLRSGYIATGAAAGLDLVGFGPANMPFGLTRTASVLAALAPVAQPEPGVTPQQLAKPPAGFVDAATDGSIFLIAVVAPPDIALLQVVGVDVSVDDAATVTLLQMLQGESPIRAELSAAIGQQVTDLGTIAFTGGGPDAAQLRRVDSDAVTLLRGSVNEQGFPVLWVDRVWAAQNAELARQVVDLAVKLAEDIAASLQEQVQVRQVIGDVGNEPTPAVLIEVYRRP